MFQKFRTAYRKSQWRSQAFFCDDDSAFSRPTFQFRGLARFYAPGPLHRWVGRHALSSRQKRNGSTCTARNLKCEPKNEQLESEFFRNINIRGSTVPLNIWNR
jgi:hypothetical protein